VNNDHASLLYSPHNVQTITITSDNDNLGGVFRIALEGHSTQDIPAKLLADDLKLELESLPTLGTIIVARESISNGLIWAITLLTNHGNISKYGPTQGLTLLFVTDTQGTSGVSLLGTGARLVVKEEVTAFKGYEEQILTTQCATPGGILGGHFALSLEGARTNEVPFNSMASDLKLELESICLSWNSTCYSLHSPR